MLGERLSRGLVLGILAVCVQALQQQTHEMRTHEKPYEFLHLLLFFFFASCDRTSVVGRQKIFYMHFDCALRGSPAINVRS